MLFDIQNGQTSVVLRVKLRNSSVSTGAGLTGLTSSSSGLIISTIADNEASATAYTVAASHVQTITTLGTYAAPSASNCRFKEVDATNHPGLYEFQFADARFAVSSAKSLNVTVSGALNLAECDFVIPLRAVNPYDVVRGGMTAFPNVVSGSAGAVLVDGTGTAAISNSAGKVLLQATQTGVTIPTVTTVTNQLTAAQVATGVWQDTTSGDFTVSSSIGKSLYTSGNAPGAASGLFIAGTNAATSITTGLTAHIIGTVDTVTTVTNQLTGAAIATAVWQDATSGDFTVASSIGKSLYIANVAPGAAGGHFIAGSNAATTVNITGNLTGNVTGSVGSVTATVGANVTQWTGNAVASTHVNGVPIVDVGYFLGIAAAVSNGTAQAGASGSITLAAGEPSTANFYVGRQITIVAGTATGQARFITAYNGSTKVATVHRAWDVTPDSTSQYTIDALVETDAYQFAGQNVVLDGNNLPNVNAKDWNGTAITTVVPNTNACNTTQIGGQAATAASGVAFPGTVMAAGNVTIGAYAGGQDPATLVLDAPIASHLSSGSTGAKINAAGSSADPLANPTSTYATPATVGYVIGHSLGNTGASLAGNVTVGAYAGGEDPATLLLASPANKLATDSTGRVILQPTQTGVTIPTVTTVTNEITASAIASVILSNPSHPLVTDNSGNAQISLTQAIPTTNTPQTTGDSLNAARAQGFGKWQLVGTTLTLFGPDGSTAVRTFTLDSATAPTQRA